MVRMYSVGLTQISALFPWYDRNPAPTGRAYAGDGLGPHSITIRASYTVPTGKKALVTTASIMLKRVTAATTAAIVEAYISAAGTLLVDVVFYGNNVDSGGDAAIGQATLLSAGSVVNLSTLDGSTGGTVTYRLQFAAVEFSLAA